MPDFLLGQRIIYGESIHLRDKWSVVIVRSGREMVVEVNQSLILGIESFNFAYQGRVLLENSCIVSL